MTHFLAKYPEAPFATIWAVADGDTPEAIAERNRLQSDQWAAFAMADWPGCERWLCSFDLVLKTGGNAVAFNLEAAKEAAMNIAKFESIGGKCSPAQADAIAAATTVDELNQAMELPLPQS